MTVDDITQVPDGMEHLWQQFALYTGSTDY